jgi:hypothetical protein
MDQAQTEFATALDMARRRREMWLENPVPAHFRVWRDASETASAGIAPCAWPASSRTRPRTSCSTGFLATSPRVRHSGRPGSREVPSGRPCRFYLAPGQKKQVSLRRATRRSVRSRFTPRDPPSRKAGLKNVVRAHREQIDDPELARVSV